MTASAAVQQAGAGRTGPVQLSILGVLIATALILFALAMSVYLSLGLHSPLLVSTTRQVQILPTDTGSHRALLRCLGSERLLPWLLLLNANPVHHIQVSADSSHRQRQTQNSTEPCCAAWDQTDSCPGCCC